MTYINRLAIALEIIAFSPRPESDGGLYASPHFASSPNHDTIWSATVDTSQKPTIVVRYERHIETVWRLLVLLSKASYEESRLC